METISIDLDPKKMTIRELEEIEELAGEPVGAIMAAITSDRLSARSLRALVVVMRRRADPAYTLDEAAGLTLAKITWERTPLPPPEGPAPEV